jgi:hypothetical protein
LFSAFHICFKVSQRLLLVSLTAAMLLQMGVVSATHMHCLTKGKDKVFTGAQKGCCPHFPLPENSIDLHCCDYDVSATTVHRTHPDCGFDLPLACARPPKTESASLNAVSLGTASGWPPMVSMPPPLSGNELLCRICKRTI